MPVRTAYAGAAIAGEVLTAANVNKLPGGWLGYAEVTANQTGITTEVDLTGLTVTVTVGTSRRIRVTGEVLIQTSATGLLAFLYIHADGSQVQKRVIVPGVAASSEMLHAEVILTPSAGSHTYKLRAASGGTAVLEASATVPSFILVEDLGPAT